MLPITSLANKLQQDFPSFHFEPGETFAWQPAKTTVYFIANSDDSPALLHETAHALLGHQEYSRDITLLAMERDAWQYARGKLAKRYGTKITEEAIDEALDSYRDWLHARSTCPQCGATGLQTKKHEYKCLTCPTKWRANEARMCALRRYTVA